MGLNIESCGHGDCEVCIDIALQKHDEVNHPKHYTYGKYECIDIIEDTLTPEQFEGFLLGNTIKYLHRRRFKGGAVSTQKAMWYLDRMVKHEQSAKKESID